MNSTLYIKTKRNIKWYKKLWNIITFQKEKNYQYELLGSTEKINEGVKK